MLKKIFLAWSVDIKKIMTGILFPIAILFAFAVLLSGTVYTSDTGETYNAITIFWKFSGEEMKEMGTELSQYEICRDGRAFWVYCPLVVLFPLIPIFVKERAGGSRRYQIVRTGKVSFAISRMLVTLLAGGMAALCGFLLFSIYVSVMFPIGEEVISTGFLAAEGCKYFLYGAVTAVLGYIVAIFIKNIYLVYCIPFIMNYLLEMCLGAFIQDTEPGRLQDMMIAIRNLSAFNRLPARVARYFIAIHIFLVIAAVIIYICYLERKTDCGD